MGQEKAGLVNEDIVKAMGAFGGGIAGSGGMCGIITGGIALFSSMYSRGNLSGKENPRMWALSDEYVEIFKKLSRGCGGINCSDIARVDWKDYKEAKAFYANPDSRRFICIKLMGDTAHALGKLLEKEKG